jgi:hypothetical protein
MEKYKGNKEPFIYALFCQKDKEEALKVLEYLSSKNYKLTYDEDKAEDCIARSSDVLLFLSNEALKEEKLLKEISLASKLNKTIISIFLEDTLLTPGLSMMLGQTQGIMKYQIDEQQFKEKLDNSEALKHMEVSEQQKAAGKKQSLLMSIGIAALAIIAAVLLIFKPFSSNSALLQQLGISGDLNSIKKVYVYGEEVRDDYEIAQFILTSDGLNDMILLQNNALDLGSIEDVTDFAKLKNLEELCLSGNNIHTIEPLLSLKNLKMLDISHNYGIDISGISALENLEVLNIAETEIEDITELKQLKNLKTLYVSADYLFMQKETLSQLSAEVKTIDEPVYTFDELKAALNKADVHSVRIINSITIPEGETITVNKDVLLRGNPLGVAEDIVVDNYGTIIVYGGFEMGLCTRNNYGTIIIKDGGAYTGGMCNSYTYGTFTIEEGGTQIHERGHSFFIEDGIYTNNGEVVFGGGGDYHFNGGQLINNGIFMWNLGDYGPGIYLDSSNYTNNGKVYLRDHRGQGMENPSSKDVDDSCVEISMNEIGSYNAS